MIEKSNYESASLAYEEINSIYQSIQSKEVSFEDAVSKSSEDLASKDTCLLYTSPSPRDLSTSRMPSSA